MDAVSLSRLLLAVALTAGALGAFAFVLHLLRNRLPQWQTARSGVPATRLVVVEQLPLPLGRRLVVVESTVPANPQTSHTTTAATPAPVPARFTLLLGPQGDVLVHSTLTPPPQNAATAPLSAGNAANNPLSPSSRPQNSPQLPKKAR